MMENTNPCYSIYRDYAKTSLIPGKIDLLKENLPEYLIEYGDFCHIKAVEERDATGKIHINKIPCNEYGNPICGFRNGKSFEEIAIPNKNVTGISLALDVDSVIFVIDIDNALINGKLNPGHKCYGLIKSLISRLDTYTEVSISGNGLHIIGKVFGGFDEIKSKTRNDWVELYHAQRVIALTGNRLEGTPKTFRCFSQNQMKELIKTLCLEDKPVFNQVKSPQSHHVNGEYSMNYALADNPTVDEAISKLLEYTKTTALFNGDWHPFYNSKSEADAGLAYYSAVHSNCDRKIMVAIMLHSNLYEEDMNGKNKWSRDDYLDTTIDNAIKLVCNQNPKMLRLVKEREQRNEGVN